jgi:uncharacterized protein
LLENRFTVPVAAEEAWNALVDVERAVVFLPGASLLSIDGDHFEGRVKVKVGPITMSFKGVANFSVKDHAARRAVIDGAGKETTGDGTAKGSMTMVVDETPDGSEVVLTTTLDITGKAAKFGRRMITDIAGRLVDQFAGALTDDLTGAAVAVEASGETNQTGGADKTAAPPMQLLSWSHRKRGSESPGTQSKGGADAID